MRFEWDEAKSRSNRLKHGIGFEEASQVFRDPLCVTVQDRIESGEQRWQTYGSLNGLTIVVVAHTISEIDEDGAEIEIIRIISARMATQKERRRYEDEIG